MDPTENLYQVLGLQPGAEQAAIKQAYRRLSMEHHPDRKPGDATAGATFARISQAYEVLGDPGLRRKYDEGLVGADGRQQQPSHPGIPEELFAAMFGGGVPGDVFGGDARTFHMPGQFVRGQPAAFHGFTQEAPVGIPDVEERIRIPLEKAYSGCTVPLVVRRWIVQGQSEREEKETLYLTVPRGVDSDEIIRVEGKGNVVDGRSGDVKVFVDVENRTNLRRDGMDLVYKCSITLKEALAGPSFEVLHLDGRRLRMKGTGAVVSPGSRKVLERLGMVRGGETGNLIVEYDVKFPARLTQEQLKALDEIL